MQMTQEEEMLIQTKMFQILEQLGISEQEFQKNAMFHGQDQMKSMQIMQMQQQTQGPSSASESAPKLTKQKTIETFKVQQEIQMESMDEMMKEGMAAGGMNPQSQEGQMIMMMKMMVKQARASDALFAKTGVEEDELNNSIQTLDLQKDPMFVMMVQENMQKVMMKAQQAQGGMGGPPGGQMPMGMF